jgi:hypothetical protein
MLALRKALEGVRHTQTSLTAASGDDLRASYSERSVDESAWWRRPEISGDGPPRSPEPLPPTRLADINLDVAKSLDRIADSIERIGAQLDSYHSERAEHLDAIEFLLREMVISSVPVTGSRSIVFGGVVESGEREADDDITIVPDGYPLVVETAVEVRSRFHDRWIAGFNIAEAVDSPGRCRYRLTRKSDGIPLPILFDACDVRPASSSYERRNTASRSSSSESRSTP